MTEKFKNKESKRIWWILGSLIAFNVVIIFITLVTYGALNQWDMGAAGNYLFNQVYLNNFFKQPALVLGFITLFGYLVMGRSSKDSIIGSLKCVIGFVLLQIGSGTLVGVAKPVFTAISGIGNKGIDVIPLDPYFALAAGNQFFQHFKVGADFISLITYVFVIAFVVNIILVIFKRWTNINSLMVTGHVMLQQAAVITPAFYILLFREIPLLNGINIDAGTQFGIMFIAGIFLGIYWGVASTSTLKSTNKVTGNAGFAIGHQQMFAIALAYKMSRYFGSPEDSAETRKMPKALKIFEDNVFVQTTIISILFITLFVILLATGTLKVNGTQFADPEIGAQWNGIFGSAHWVLNIFGGSIKLVAALICMMTGVRMFVTELQQSFTGISEKLVKDAVIAVDIAAVYGFAPNSVTFAFASGTIAQFVGTFVTIGLSLIPGATIAIVIPLFVTLFFNSGAIGPYANVAGGVRAVIIVPAIIGFIEIIVIAFGLWAISYGSNEIGSATQYTFIQDINTSSIPTLNEVNNLFGEYKNQIIHYNQETGQIILNSSFDINVIPGLKDKLLSSDGQLVTTTWNANPFAAGYIGMGDWTLFFGSLLLISGWSIIIAWIAIPIYLIIMLAYGWILDSDKQHKKTWLQRILKLNPEIKPQC